MSLLLSSDALERRRAAVRGPLAPLAASLRHDLQPLLDRGFVIPTDKALLSRDGGRCPRDGVPLDFDPYAPHEHRCPVCGERFVGERHYLAWVMWYQLWLAERSVHAATLHALTGEAALADLAARILAGYADAYLRYPNRDNVLGPGRPFFSTYLESIWLLQLCVALDLLEISGVAGTLSDEVRERIIAPSTAIIASFDEGSSNRQVWNDAALLAAGVLLGDRALAARAVSGPSGVRSHIEHGLLSDGSWYEGENYHFFAHRGLWYGVTMAECAGLEVSPALRDRFQEGFSAPLATALPDFTFPSRRDSQYGISLRQWRFAESCELGLARAPDPRLVGALRTLYTPGAAPSRDTGRWRSTAESERNEPAAALTRADLGWRSLLLAREEWRADEAQWLTPRSALMEGQGIAVLRRREGEVYVALDYGQSGGGHGHPDRLNALLMRGAERWLDDMGTGSYVDPSLHWYRSTLAHNAPLVDGRSQPRVAGVLRAFEERDDAGWVDAELPTGSIAPGVRVRRSVVAMRHYSVDRVEWASERDIRLELPLHFAAHLAPAAEWTSAPLDGSRAPEDGYAFAHDAAFTAVAAQEVLELRRGDEVVAWVMSDVPVEWWRASAPGAPGKGESEFFVLRMRGVRGTVHFVWNWGSAVQRVCAQGGAESAGVSVELFDGIRHDHSTVGDRWEVMTVSRSARQRTLLGGVRAIVASVPGTGDDDRAVLPLSDTAYAASFARTPVVLPAGVPVVFELGRDSYRISEESWEEAGRPSARLTFRVLDGLLTMDVDITKSTLTFRPVDAVDPRLDNENADINSDGVQLHLYVPEGRGLASWLAIPEPGGRARVHAGSGAGSDVQLSATWHPTNSGYSMNLAVPLAQLGARPRGVVGVQVVVNDMAPLRARRRGQLVLAGGAGEHVYLRGDRESPVAFTRFVLGDV
ncbi:MAG TPA: heparinase II/III family protein [Gemmatimonadaceae bacterium]|nr:heparinase II/III family protein [Gemmatimonadaceae bacterium]